MRVICKVTAILLMAVIIPLSTATNAQDTVVLAAEVRAAETAFAQTMADRDAAAFGQFVAEDAVFLGNQSVLRGRAAILSGWARFFDGDDAPFSWAPETVEVLESGDLAISSGPVLDPDGNRVGTFNSVWRLENGSWKVVLDKGCPPCNCDGGSE